MNTGIVFPGMGPAGYAELGKFMATDPGARRLRRTADEVLGYSLMDRYRDAGADYSEYSQVAFLICCLALSEHADELAGSKPLACAGPSFGAKTAIAYSGALSFGETVLLTARLARCEEEYFLTEYQDVITQSVARTPWPALRDILAAMTDRSEWHDISCHIDQDFHMVSLRASSLDRFLREVRAAGGLPLYAMRPPMHCAAFAPLRRKAEEEVLGDFVFRDPGLPIIADQDGSAVRSAASARGMLLDGFVRPVRWPDVVASMKGAGIVRIYISGPDSLFGRVPCTTANLEVVPVNHKTARRTANYSMVLSDLRRDQACGMNNSKDCCVATFLSFRPMKNCGLSLRSGNSASTRWGSSTCSCRWNLNMISGWPTTICAWTPSARPRSCGPLCQKSR